MKIKFKLILVGFVVIAILIGVIGFAHARTSQRITDDIGRVDELFELLVDHDVAELEAVSHIKGALDHTRIASYKLILGHDGAKEDLKTSIEEFDMFIADLEESLRAAAAAAAADIDKDLNDLAEIEKDHEHLHDDIEKLISFVEAGDNESAAKLLNSEIDAELGALHELVEAFEKDAVREIAEIGEKVDSLIHDAAAAAAAAAAGEILTIAVVVAILLALGMGVFVSRSISKPLKELQEVAEAVAKGDLTKWVEIKGADEISRLGEAFNLMTASLIEAQKLPQNILKSMKDVLFVVDIDGKITEVNEAALETLGYEKKELIGQFVSKVFETQTAKKTNQK